MTDVRVLIVDVYVLKLAAGAVKVLVLRRSPHERSAGTWETVHGHLREGEAPVAGARRELLEETGLVAERLYNASRVESFYLHGSDEVALIPVFAAFVAEGSTVSLSDEHDSAEWLDPEEASRRFTWPRERRALADILALLSAGHAGGVEDVLRVE